MNCFNVFVADTILRYTGYRLALTAILFSKWYPPRAITFLANLTGGAGYSHRGCRTEMDSARSLLSLLARRVNQQVLQSVVATLRDHMDIRAFERYQVATAFVSIRFAKLSQIFCFFKCTRSFIKLDHLFDDSDGPRI